MSKRISVVLVVRNEEKKIKKCLESIKWCDEIIVVDQSSTDRTLDIVRKYTTKIFIRDNSGYCEFDREFAVSKAENEWVLMIDADEIISQELKVEIIDVLTKKNFDVCYIPRKTFFSGKWIKGCGWYPGYVPRLFRKGYVKFEPKLHMDGKALSKNIVYLKNPILHFSYDDISEWFEKLNRYTSITAKEYFLSGLSPSLGVSLKELLFRPVYFFVLKFIVLKGFLDGWRGLFISLSSAFTVIVSYFKFLELYEKNKQQ